ncbi:MAG: flagellar basal body rod protein FlgC, partial [Planctomycetales bacterium]|nr:flagellar basal body rod protein FlgC [Planctomycetales bacterium]
MGRYLSATAISASGLTAERMRMEVAANNIANAYTTRTPEGGPYRRQQVVFASSLNEALGSPHDGHSLGGVQIVGIQPDTTELPV